MHPMDLMRSFLRMLQLALMRRELCFVTRDHSGGWLHRYLHGGRMVTPQPRKSSWRLAKQAAHDIFFFDYTPRHGDVVVELGAGCGTETVLLSGLVGPRGQVIACEAHPWTVELLRRTCEENGLDNVEIVHAAVTGARGMVTISDHHVDRNIGNRVSTDGLGIEVPAMTLDDLCQAHSLKQVDFLKVNIEGAEGPMLKGMSETLKGLRHAAISCHDFAADILGDEFLRTRSRVVSFFESAGGRVRSRPTDPRYFVRDYLYVSM